MKWKKKSILRFLCLVCLIVSSDLLMADWGAVQALQTNGNNLNPDVAMNNSGKALGVWEQTVGTSTAVQAAFFNGSNWESPVTLSSGGNASDAQVVFNNQGQGFAIWLLNDGTNTTAQVAHFNGTIWESPITLSGNESQGPSIVLNDAGIAFAAWSLFDGSNYYIRVAQYNGNSWSAYQGLASSSFKIYPELVINAKSHALLATGSDQQASTEIFYYNGTSWNQCSIANLLELSPIIPLLNDNDEGAVIYGQRNFSMGVWTISSMLFDGANWTDPVQLSPLNLNGDFPDADMNNHGAIIVIWRAYETTLFHFPQTVYYNGNAWSAPLALSTSDSGYSPQVQLNEAGNGIAIWRGSTNTNAGTTFTQAAMFSNGLWGDVMEISYSGEVSQEASLSLNENGQAISIWEDVANVGNAYIEGRLFSFVPFGWTGIYGSITQNRFATQIDRIKVIEWDPLPSSIVLSYQIFRNGDLIATVPAGGPLQYEDHNRSKRKKDTYRVAAITTNGSVDFGTISL